jgi:cbb3-type cytochrome oxidase subunit 3
MPAMGTIVGILIFVGFTVGIWFSYRLFMRGDTAEEKVAALLPPDFKPDLFHRKGDTYVGYEKAKNRLVLVDWPHAKVLSPTEVLSLESVHQSMLGVTHHWVAVNVPDPAFSQYRIWFQFRPAKRDAWLSQLAQICKK